MREAFMYQFYIGSNNQSHKIELDKIREVLADYEVKGYTILDSLGYWEGKPEDSIILQVEGITKSKALTLLQVFKTRLEQVAIGLQRLPEVQFI